jgi:hypothetical protein
MVGNPKPPDNSCTVRPEEAAALRQLVRDRNKASPNVSVYAEPH